MRRSLTARALMFGTLAALLVPATASADIYDSGALPDSVGINSLWVIVAGLFVFFMQAGFAFLEIGFSRGKNAGTIVAKILVNLSIAAILYWAVGFAFAFGGDAGHVIGSHGFFLRDYGAPPIVIGPAYAGKTIELCAPGDTICDGTPGGGPTIAHAMYPMNGMVDQAAAFSAGRL